MSLADEVERLKNKDQTRYDFTDFLMDVQKDLASFFAPQTVKSIIKAQNPLTYNELDNMLIKALDRLYVEAPRLEWTDSRIKEINDLTRRLNQVVGKGTPSNRHLFAKYASKLNKEIDLINEQVDAKQKENQEKYEKEIKEADKKRAKNEVSRQIISDAYYDAKTDPSEDNLATFVKLVEGDSSTPEKVAETKKQKNVLQDRTYIPVKRDGATGKVHEFFEDIAHVFKGEPTSIQQKRTQKIPKGGN